MCWDRPEDMVVAEVGIASRDRQKSGAAERRQPRTEGYMQGRRAAPMLER